MVNRFSPTVLSAAGFLLVAVSTLAAQGADLRMQVVKNDYLSTQGFDVMLYDSTYHPVFVDQKNTAMEMILHDQRIATNGDVRLMPTPEQWDLVATLKERHADHANNRLTASLAFPAFGLSYTLEVAAEPGGVKVTVNLDKPLPEKLAGRAGFNLEFLPSIYMGKAYLVDGTKAGIFPRTPDDPMIKVLPLPDEPKKAYYLEDWDKAKGYTQPLPFAQGRSITLGVDDALARINVKSETADLMLYDGRDRAQNGWFVLRSLIPTGKTTGAIVWHIRPDVIPNWTPPPWSRTVRSVTRRISPRLRSSSSTPNTTPPKPPKSCASPRMVPTSRSSRAPSLRQYPGCDTSTRNSTSLRSRTPASM